MNKHKLDYEAPEASTFVVRFEGCLCQSPGGYTEGGGGQYGDDDIIDNGSY